MTGLQCDTCRKFALPPADGWFVLAQNQPADMSPLAMFSSPGGSELAGTFCSITCVAQYAYVRAVTEGTAVTGDAGRMPGAEGWLG